jgi:hypothetical protein
MSRWTKDEDDYILEFIQEIQDDINYTDLITAHNKTFNTKRTETTYKARMTKIAKENNISLNQKPHWTSEDKEYIVKKVHESPLDIKWEEIATHLNRSEDRVKRVYLDLISPQEQIEHSITNITEINLGVFIDKMKYVCVACNRKQFTPLHEWQEKEYCDECYDTLFGEEIQTRWNHAHKYSVERNKVSCNLCSKQAIINNNIVSRFHYDHINMFDKSFSICELIKNGSSLTDIYNEIDKCQLLCISCHKLVTKIENQCGFVRYKKQILKEYNETNDIDTKEAKQKEYSNVYNNFMSNIYSLIKATI